VGVEVGARLCAVDDDQAVAQLEHVGHLGARRDNAASTTG
jgi:hypothetical protein